MVPRETVSFVFPRVLLSFQETSGLKGKHNSVPRDHTLNVLLYIEIILEQKQTNKDGVRATTAQLYQSQDTFEFDQGHVTKNQPITVLILLSESVAI